VCPACHGPVYTNRYTLWHVLIALVFFPFGIAAFAGPIKHCTCGTDYGAGVVLVRSAKIGLAAAAMAAIGVFLLARALVHSLGLARLVSAHM
jgi:hypothetical protein